MDEEEGVGKYEAIKDKRMQIGIRVVSHNGFEHVRSLPPPYFSNLSVWPEY